MSTDWNIKCVDCDDTLRFEDANHQSGLMLALCKHADAIAAFADVMADPVLRDVKFWTPWGAIDTAWFRSHLGHQIIPVDEYGRVLNQCYMYERCECGASHPCSLELGHEGPCRKAQR